MAVLTAASFFSGIGGLDLGFERAGFRLTVQCEIKPYCRAVLEKHWPDVPHLTDIKEVSCEQIPASTVWTAGFPCQDISLASMGPRSGLKGKRSGLFYDLMRLVRGSLPTVLVLENVPALLTSHGGRDFAIVLKSLDELGYGVAWRVLNSKDFGVPQQRRCVYIVAIHRDPRGAADVLFEPECSAWDTATGRSYGKKPPSLFQTVLGNISKGPLTKALAHCVYAESARHTGTDWSRNYVWYPNGRVRRFTPKELERVQGFPVDWTLLSKSKFPESKRNDSLRYHAIGNAVTPQVAEWLAERLKWALKAHSSRRIKEHVRLVAAE